MKLNVPFYKQSSIADCGPTALRMVLSYYGKNPSINNIKEKCEIKKDKGISTIQIAIAAAKFGYKSSLYTTSLGFKEDNMELEFYKKYADPNLIKETRTLINNAKDLGVELNEISLSLREIKSLVNKNSLPIILLDWAVVLGKKNYLGHFVPIVGFDEEGIYVHNQGIKAKKFLHINSRIFNKARRAKGTDEDFLVISRR